MELGESVAPLIAGLAQETLQYSTKDGIVILLKQFAGRETIKSLGKWVPIIGQVVAGTIGYAVTYSAGKAYSERCYKLAEAVLEKSLKV